MQCYAQGTRTDATKKTRERWLGASFSRQLIFLFVKTFLLKWNIFMCLYSIAFSMPLDEMTRIIPCHGKDMSTYIYFILSKKLSHAKINEVYDYTYLPPYDTRLHFNILKHYRFSLFCMTFFKFFLRICQKTSIWCVFCYHIIINNLKNGHYMGLAWTSFLILD